MRERGKWKIGAADTHREFSFADSLPEGLSQRWSKLGARKAIQVSCVGDRNPNSKPSLLPLGI